MKIDIESFDNGYTAIIDLLGIKEKLVFNSKEELILKLASTFNIGVWLGNDCTPICLSCMSMCKGYPKYSECKGYVNKNKQQAERG